VIKGGKDGVVIVKGNAGASDMIRRVSLSPGDDDFMPREGNPPLTADQIAILRWWIDAGAKTGVNVGSLKAPSNVTQLIAGELHLGGASPGVSMAAAATPAFQTKELARGVAGDKADPRLVGALVGVGFMVRQVSMADAHLIVSPTAPGAQFTAAQIAALANTGANQITQLDLSDAGLDDAAAAPLAHLSDLVELRLNSNKLTDKTVQALGGLTKLTALGLYGNQGISDASLPVIGGMKSLRRVFLWGTGVTAAGVQKLRASRPDLLVDFGDETAPAAAPPQQAAAGRTTH
jgi:Leucine-rich repeat (LRR) protein